MDFHIQDYCEHICKEQIKVLCKNHKKGVWYWDLPAMASICHDGNYTRMARGYAHDPKGTKWHSLLISKMGGIGGLGNHSTKGKRYILGRCSEQHAGNNYIKSYKSTDLNDLYFSESVRPRTMEVFPPCDNCKYIFPNLNL